MLGIASYSIAASARKDRNLQCLVERAIETEFLPPAASFWEGVCVCLSLWPDAELCCASYGTHVAFPPALTPNVYWPTSRGPTGVYIKVPFPDREVHFLWLANYFWSSVCLGQS